MSNYNAANRKHVRAAEKAQVLSGTINREVVCDIMSVQNGRQWMYERLASAYIFADPFSPDPAIHAYQAGLRAHAILLFNDIILYAADSFTLMIREHNERSAASERAREQTPRRDVEGSEPAAAGAEYEYEPGDDAGNEAAVN